MQGRESSFTYEGYEGRFTYDSQSWVRVYNYIKSDSPNASELYSFNYLGADTVRMYRYAALLYQGDYSPQTRLLDYYYLLNSAQQPVFVFGWQSNSSGRDLLCPGAVCFGRSPI